MELEEEEEEERRRRSLVCSSCPLCGKPCMARKLDPAQAYCSHSLPCMDIHEWTGELEEEEEEERRRRRRIVEDEFEDVSWETLDEDARANLYYYVVDNFLTAEHFSCYPLEEDEIQPPQSSDDEVAMESFCPHMLSSAAHHWLWSPATGWQRAREVDAESVAA